MEGYDSTDLIKKYAFFFNDITCPNKRNNVKKHIKKHLHTDCNNDSQTYLFNVCIKLYEDLQKEKSINKKLDTNNDIINNVFTEMKLAIENKDITNIIKFEDFEEDVIEKERNKADVNGEKYSKLWQDYQISVGVKIPHFKQKLENETVYIYICSRRNYLSHIEWIDEDMKKSTGIEEIQLTQYKNELLKNKELDKYR